MTTIPKASLPLAEVIERLRSDPRYAENVVKWRTLEARPAAFADYPDWVHPDLLATLKAYKYERLFTHQREASDLARAGKHVCVVTPTASGKTLCYNLPVLDAMVRKEGARALYLFPTKALSQDQVAELNAIVERLPVGVRAFTYDGDTPSSTRAVLRETGEIIVTNPYMLHSGILPNHVKWTDLFQGLRYVIVDELHAYRGVFGSHVANVFRRLRRIARHYGTDPVFLSSSATIANPAEHAQRLLGVPVEVLDRSGAPRGERHFALYNPPVVNRDLGLRANALEEVRRLSDLFAGGAVQAIYFVRARQMVEVLTKYLKDRNRTRGFPPETVCAYRGGYLPKLRREIEKGLRTGEIHEVVSTNALELGVDIGSLDVAVLTGYPGTLASTLQQSGRAGRRGGLSLAILVCRSTALDQYIAAHPEYVFERPEERAVTDPDNLIVFVSHLKCAAFELPFDEGELFGGNAQTTEVLDYLAREARILHKAGGRYHWMAEAYPAEDISLSAADVDYFVVIDEERNVVMAEVDRPDAMTQIHEGAIYGHQGEQFLITRLEYDDRRAYAKRINPDYFTEAEVDVDVRVVAVDESKEGGLGGARLRQGYGGQAGGAPDGSVQGGSGGGAPAYVLHRGEVGVKTLATVYKKIKFYTRENVGAGEIALPPEEMETTGVWMLLEPAAAAELNLFDPRHAGGWSGLGYLLQHLLPVYLGCGVTDVRRKTEIKSAEFDRPSLFLFDNVPGGVGLAEKIYELWPVLLRTARESLEGCPCTSGCPACVGPGPTIGNLGKQVAKAILRRCSSPSS
ncbi:MAG: DEAD/DEAH box helicase [Planctomycetes bacterium]|nr:DEAD/DEAH box helicase [Planctomycetota bacterium]